MAAIALLAVAALCAVPMQGSDADYMNIDGEDVIGTGTEAEYQAIYTNNDYADYQDVTMGITYTASLVDSSGTTVSRGVSPSSGSLDSGVPVTLTVDAPDDAGRYTLKVVYKVEVTYASEDGEDTEEVSLEKTDEYSIRVVEPITLSVTLTNSTATPLQGYGVYFVVDGEKMDDSYTILNLDANGTGTVSYDWITAAGAGAHTFSVVGADGGNIVDIEGLGETHTFYIGDNSYTWLVAILVVIIIVVVLVMVWVYRKPVKNYGKPKSRR